MKYNQNDDKKSIESRLNEMQQNFNVPIVRRNSMIDVLQYKLDNLNSDNMYCQGFVV
jgi:hypothetical protein